MSFSAKNGSFIYQRNDFGQTFQCVQMQQSSLIQTVLITFTNWVVLPMYDAPQASQVIL